jgi:tRNA dimethylallyltransferase
MTSKTKVVLVCGPTAAGKTKIGVELAKRLGTEVISADSRQFYRELDVGTAKPAKAEMEGITHHFIDSHSIEKPISAGDYAREARPVLEKLLANRQVPLVVGGSGLYIDALLEGLDDLPVDHGLRDELRRVLHDRGHKALLDRLEKEDPSSLKLIDVNNPVRVMRALELVILEGKSLAEIRKKRGSSPLKYPTVGICVSPTREHLYKRINDRVEEMIESGLEQEVRKLIPFRESDVLQTVGYREFFSYFDGKTDRHETIRLIKRNTRRYAKRQMTWFRRKEYLHWTEPEPIERVMALVVREINR